MKRPFYALIFLLFLSIIGCQKEEPNSVPKSDPVKVTSVSLYPTSLTLTVGEEQTLLVTVYPQNASDKTVIWSSSNDYVASVTDGRVSAIHAGEAIIYAKSKDSEKEGSCKVRVILSSNNFSSDEIAIPEMINTDW